MVEVKVIELKGLAEAETRKASELASVAAQITLSESIGENKDYQEYLVRLKQIEVNGETLFKVAQANGEALKSAEVKLLVNAGDVQSGMNKLSDIFSSKGASQLNGIIEGLSQTEIGKNVLSLLDKSKQDNSAS